jgi:acetyl esterase/lipase
MLLSLGVLAVMVSPSMPVVEMAAVSALAYAFNPFLLVVAAIGVVIVVLGLRHRRRVIALIAGITTALLATAVVVPTAVLTQAATERDIVLSVPALVASPSGGLDAPTDTATYTGDLQLDVWQAENRGDAANSALIYVFGGGYKSGTRADWAPFFQHLTSQGISVFAMDYTLSTTDEPSYESAASDVACAVGWVRENADVYDIDADRLVLAGGSAGANLALLTAYSAGADAITPSCEVGDTSVRAVIDFYGPVDLAETAETTGSPAVADSLEQYLGATPEEEPARYELLSPSTYIDGDVPPTLILHGDRDSGVPLAQSTGLAESLDDAGVPNELVVVPAAEHGFDAAWGSFANQIAQAEVTRFFDEYVTN